MNREAYEKLIEEDIAWLLKQPRTLERCHIEQILRDSPRRMYDGAIALDFCEFNSKDKINLRQAFEIWCETEAMPCELSTRFVRDEEGCYKSPTTDAEWDAWMAGIEFCLNSNLTKTILNDD